MNNFSRTVASALFQNRSTDELTTASFSNTTIHTHWDEVVYPPAVDYTLKALYIIVAASGLIGNSVIIYLFASKRVRLTAFNILLFSLSLSDALADLSLWVYIFVDLKSIQELKHDLADFLCTATMGQFTYWTAMAATLNSLSAISICRYVIIRYPLKASSFKRIHAWIIVCLIIWPAAIAMTFPGFISLQYNDVYAVCWRVWPHGINGLAYIVSSGVIGYGGPIFLLCFTLIATRRQLWLTKDNDVARSIASAKRRRKAVILLAALILTFFIFWTPMFIYWVLSRTFSSMFPDGPDGEYARMRIIRVVVLISLGNTVADPIIYILRGEDFRNSLFQIRQNLPRNFIQ
eukprot:Seg4393.2 transcript_id=Seg4393.2/GoldUCD/mRNA.D3Y31 product="Somatostatin receptor type 4" protein_id=Seg4393.2/GoldUCD/D3Y31